LLTRSQPTVIPMSTTSAIRVHNGVIVPTG
jgi:hypothetical protein